MRPRNATKDFLAALLFGALVVLGSAAGRARGGEPEVKAALAKTFGKATAPPQATPEPHVKGGCSGLCTCGCNDGGECDCGPPRDASTVRRVLPTYLPAPSREIFVMPRTFYSAPPATFGGFRRGICGPSG